MATDITKKEVDPKLLAISQAIENAYNNAVVTPHDVRLALMDYPEFNIPLYIEYLDDAKLWKCIEWGCKKFNETRPKLTKNYTTADFPDVKLLTDLATIEALKLTALRDLRGEMQYSDGGIQSTIFYKSERFTQLRQELQSDVAQQMASIKRAMNINECYGHLC